MRRITIPLEEPELRSLAQLAAREHRDPRQQATVLVLEGLRRVSPDHGQTQPAAAREPVR